MEPLRAVGSGAPAPQDAPELVDLVRRSSRGDEQAFATLYDATSARAFGLALRVVRDPAQAEEVTQEAFLDVWRHSSRYRADRGSVIGWLLTIVHRKAVDRVRSAEAAGRRDETYHQQAAVDHDQTVEAVQTSMDSQRVRTALKQLTTNQREALGLAFYGGYTHTEVAAMLDLPLGTAKTRIRDALIRMRDALGGHDE